jgi:iron complex transport system ATP-binding protein
MNFIKIKKMRVAYEECHLIQDISFEVKQEGFFVVMGANGSGKSTLLKAMVGIIPQESELYDYSDLNLLELDRQSKSSILSYMPQSPEIEENLTVEDYFHYTRFPQMRSFRRLNEKELFLRNDILKRLRVSHLLGRRVGEVSGGELKKIMIGGTFFQGTHFVLLDEPFQALDPVVKVEVADFLKYASSHYQVGIIMACHDLYWARKLADQMLFLKNGAILNQGPTKTIFTKENLAKLYGQAFAQFDDRDSDDSVFLPRATE